MKKAAFLMTAAMSVLFFQNCDGGRVGFRQDAQLIESGNGGNYDGKPDPGTYYRVVPDLRCGKEAALYGQIVVTRDAMISKVMDLKDCLPVETRLDFSQVEVSSSHRTILGAFNGIFEKREHAPDLSERNQLLPEAWCRSIGSEGAPSIDTVVRTNIDQNTSLVSLSRDQEGVVASSKTVSRSAENKSLSFRSSAADFELDLEVDLSQASSATQLFSAKMRAVVGHRVFDAPLICRTGARLDPVAPQKPLTCPVNYSRVPALAGYTDSDFCVAKYEAKRSGSLALSRADSLPWTSPKLSEAIAACQANGLAYDLVSNDEWQALARNIESVAINWGGGVIGSAQGLNRGHSDNSPSVLLEASSDDNLACYGLNQGCDLSTWSLYRRTHQLTTGEIVWDLGGNVWERTKTLFNQPLGADIMVYQITDPVTKALLGAAGDYRSLTTEPWGGLGKADIASTNGTIVRGSHFQAYGSGGIFRSTLGYEANYSDDSIGFRCVYHP